MKYSERPRVIELPAPLLADDGQGNKVEVASFRYDLQLHGNTITCSPHVQQVHSINSKRRFDSGGLLQAVIDNDAELNRIGLMLLERFETIIRSNLEAVAADQERGQ